MSPVQDPRKTAITKFRRKFQLTYPLNDSTYGVAVSGGADSVAAAILLLEHFNKSVILFHFNHGTEFCDAAQQSTYDFYARHYTHPVGNILDFKTGSLSRQKTSREGWQDYWRAERMAYLLRCSKEHGVKIVLGHNLNDVAETWISSAINGSPKLIPSAYGPEENLIRPFLTVEKEDFRGLLEEIKEPYFECPSNADTKYTRNFIRHQIMPKIEELRGRGFLSTMRNKLMHRMHQEANQELC